MEFVRKFAPNKWKSKDFFSDDSNFQADALTSCLRTSNNSLSLWKCQPDEYGKYDFSDIVCNFICDQQKFSRISFVIISEENIVQKKINYKHNPSEAKIESIANNHYSLIELTDKKLIAFAELIKNNYNRKLHHVVNPIALKEIILSKWETGSLLLQKLDLKNQKDLSLNIIKYILSKKTIITPEKRSSVAEKIINDCIQNSNTNLDINLNIIIGENPLIIL